MKYGAVVPVLNDLRWVRAVTGQLLKSADRVVVLRSPVAHSGAGLVDLAPMCELDPRVEFVLGNWASEAETRNHGQDMMADCDYVFTLDADEIMSTAALDVIKKQCAASSPRVVCARFYTYWKTPEYAISPPEAWAMPVALRKDVRYMPGFSRVTEKGEVLSGNQFLVHHLSYVRTDAEMKEKLATFSHSVEVVPHWYDRVWKAWDDDHYLENLHPTHPTAYARAVKAPNARLSQILDEFGCV